MSPTGTLQFLMLNRCGVNSVKYIYGKISPMSNENPFVKTIFFSNFGSNQVNRCNDMALIRLYIYIYDLKKRNDAAGFARKSPVFSSRIVIYWNANCEEELHLKIYYINTRTYSCLLKRKKKIFMNICRASL